MDAFHDANSEDEEGFCCQSFARKVSVRARHSHLMMTIKNMFSPGCRGGLRNRQLLMNTSETADNVRLVARHRDVFLGVFYPANLCPQLPGITSSFVGDVPGRRLHGKGSRGVYTGIIGEMGQ